MLRNFKLTPERVSIISLILAFISVAIAIIAYLYPRAPGPNEINSSIVGTWKSIDTTKGNLHFYSDITIQFRNDGSAKIAEDMFTNEMRYEIMDDENIRLTRDGQEYVISFYLQDNDHFSTKGSIGYITHEDTAEFQRVKDS